MIIIPRQHRQYDGQEEEVTMMQFTGWVFESHLWELDDKESFDITLSKTCKWCGKKHTGDIKEYAEKHDKMTLCPKNPLVLMERRRSIEEFSVKVKNIVKDA